MGAKAAFVYLNACQVGKYLSSDIANNFRGLEYEGAFGWRNSPSITPTAAFDIPFFENWKNKNLKEATENVDDEIYRIIFENYELTPLQSLQPHVYSSLEQVKQKYWSEVKYMFDNKVIFNPVFVLEDKNEK